VSTVSSRPSHLDALFAAAGRAYRPVGAMIEITHRCHLACVHCYLEDNHAWGDKARELTTAEIIDIIDQLRAAGCMFLTITGGEVFLRPDLLPILRHARGRGLAVVLFTTGTLLTPEHVDELARLHLRRVELSLYSADAQVHDAITQRDGSHVKTMGALHALLARRIPVVIKCPLMRSNFESYEGLKTLSRELGISLKIDSSITPMNDGDLRPTRERLTQTQLVAFYSKPELREFGQVDRRLPRAEDSICGIGKRGCVIGPFGDVHTCMGFKPAIGNLRERSFAEIWRDTGVLYQLRRASAANVDVCGSCEKFSYCNRCAGTALAEDGSFDGPSSWSCHLAAAKEKAAGLPVTPSAAERLGLVQVIEGPKGHSLRVLRGKQAVAGGGCASGCGSSAGSGPMHARQCGD
jgi:radical SAM protein with 4Fe4S-binding SPASM domain